MSDEHMGHSGAAEEAEGSATNVERSAKSIAYDKMRAYVTVAAPELLQYLHRPNPRTLSIEYVLSSAISHAENPVVKAKLVEIDMERHVADGSPASQVRLLEYAQVAELDMPQYGPDFVRGLYDSALESGNPGEAWSIALTTMLKAGRLFKGSEDEIREYTREWRDRELQALTAHARDVVAKFRENSDLDTWTAHDLDLIHNMITIKRWEGHPQVPEDVYFDVIRTMVQYEVNRGRISVALRYAVEGGLPEEEIAQLQAQLKPDAQTRVRSLMTQLNGRITRFFKPDRVTA
jgi:hypothetical protein